MKQSEFLRNVVAGLFVIIGIFLIISFITTIGQDKGFARSKFQLRVLFSNVGGLFEGAPVRLSGVNVGSVSDISFLPRQIDGRRVKVVLNIYTEYKEQFENNLTFEIKTEGILGEKLVEISIIEGGENVDLAKPLYGQDPMDIQDMAEGFSQAAESFAKTSENLGRIDMVELTNVMTQSSRSLITTADGINEIMDDIQEVTRKTKRLVDRIEQRVIEGELFKVF
jgi:phospholipid/cholesterol/gamma-HCH transport system substrate-binding protein